MFRDVVKRRKMVRNYTDAPVADAAIERILDAGRRTPSAGFSQGHAFVVITGRENRQVIAEAAGESEYVARGFEPWISRAPVLIVLTMREGAYHERYLEDDKTGGTGVEREWPVPFWWVDAGAAMQNVLLAAVDEGLAAGFLDVDADPLRELLGIPETVHIVGLITIGHPAPDRKSGSLKRGWREDFVHRETW